MAPSAKNWQEVDVYVVLPQATYRYDAKAQALIWVACGDLRPLAGRQGFVHSALLNLVFVVNLACTDSVGKDEKVLWAAANVGFVS